MHSRYPAWWWHPESDDTTCLSERENAPSKVYDYVNGPLSDRDIGAPQRLAEFSLPYSNYADHGVRDSVAIPAPSLPADASAHNNHANTTEEADTEQLLDRIAAYIDELRFRAHRSSSSSWSQPGPGQALHQGKTKGTATVLYDSQADDFNPSAHMSQAASSGVRIQPSVQAAAGLSASLPGGNRVFERASARATASAAISQVKCALV